MNLFFFIVSVLLIIQFLQSIYFQIHLTFVIHTAMFFYWKVLQSRMKRLHLSVRLLIWLINPCSFLSAINFGFSYLILQWTARSKCLKCSIMTALIAPSNVPPNAGNSWLVLWCLECLPQGMVFYYVIHSMAHYDLSISASLWPAASNIVSDIIWMGYCRLGKCLTSIFWPFSGQHSVELGQEGWSFVGHFVRPYWRGKQSFYCVSFLSFTGNMAAY